MLCIYSPVHGDMQKRVSWRRVWYVLLQTVTITTWSVLQCCASNYLKYWISSSWNDELIIIVGSIFCTTLYLIWRDLIKREVRQVEKYLRFTVKFILIDLQRTRGELVDPLDEQRLRDHQLRRLRRLWLKDQLLTAREPLPRPEKKVMCTDKAHVGLFVL